MTTEEKNPDTSFEKLVKVASSDPKSPGYLVRVEIAAVYCQCKGFAYRQTCRHLNEALVATFGLKEMLEAKNG